MADRSLESRTNSRREAPLIGTTSLQMLNLGCGRKHIEGTINLDCTPDTQPDVVHNLNLAPWPFADNYFREIQGFDVIEHLQDIVCAMEEIHRIARPGALVRLTSTALLVFQIHTQIRPTDTTSGFSPSITSPRRASFRSTAALDSADAVFSSFSINAILQARMAPRQSLPAAYERRWAWIFPAWYLYFELEVVK